MVADFKGIIKIRQHREQNALNTVNARKIELKRKEEELEKKQLEAEAKKQAKAIFEEQLAAETLQGKLTVSDYMAGLVGIKKKEEEVVSSEKQVEKADDALAQADESLLQARGQYAVAHINRTKIQPQNDIIQAQLAKLQENAADEEIEENTEMKYGRKLDTRSD